jgi:hypothetical protein
MRASRRGTLSAVSMAAVATALLLAALTAPTPLDAQQTAKPVLHGKHWVAITGKPLGATAGALMARAGTRWTPRVPCWLPPPRCGTC